MHIQLTKKQITTVENKGFVQRTDAQLNQNVKRFD